MVHVLVEAGCYNEKETSDNKEPRLLDLLQNIVTLQIDKIAKKPENQQSTESEDEILFPLDDEIVVDENATKVKPNKDTIIVVEVDETDKDNINYVALSKKNKSALTVTHTALKIIDSLIEIQLRNRVFSFLATFSKTWSAVQTKSDKTMYVA